MAQFIYGKGYIDEQKFIVISKKNKIEISIDQIRKEEYSENQIPLSLQVFKTKCPNYVIQILQYNTTYIVRFPVRLAIFCDFFSSGGGLKKFFFSRY